MSLGMIARLRVHRRPAAMIAAGLIAAQALLTGLALARAALVETPGLAEFVVICHGNGGGGADSDRGSAPGPLANPHPCCVSCTAGAPPATLPEQLIALRSDRRGVLEAPILRAASILIAPRAVHDGPSQAPPSLA